MLVSDKPSIVVTILKDRAQLLKHEEVRPVRTAPTGVPASLAAACTGEGGLVDVRARLPV